jgi:hypothetical protein
MKTIIHQMTLLGDQLTNRDKIEYYMVSLANKPNLVKKIDLSRTFDKTCHDIVDFVSKEKYIATIRKQHHHNIPPGVFLNTMKEDKLITTLTRSLFVTRGLSSGRVPKTVTVLFPLKNQTLTLTKS